MPFMSFDPTDNNFGPRIGSMVQVNFKTAIDSIESVHAEMLL